MTILSPSLWSSDTGLVPLIFFVKPRISDVLQNTQNDFIFCSLSPRKVSNANEENNTYFFVHVAKKSPISFLIAELNSDKLKVQLE